MQHTKYAALSAVIASILLATSNPNQLHAQEPDTSESWRIERIEVKGQKLH